MAPGQQVAVYLGRANIDEQPHHITTMPRDRLALYSANFRYFLANNPVPREEFREVAIDRGSPAALRHVLKCIMAHDKRKDELYINMRDFPTTRKIAVWDACNVLDLEPESTMKAVLGTTTWALTHEKTIPVVMKMVWDTFGKYRDGEDETKKRPLSALIHQYAWDLVHGVFSKQEIDAIEAEYMHIPALNDLVKLRTAELQLKKIQHDQWAKHNKARDNKRQAKQQQRTASLKQVSM